jgi:hypothetical protein
MVAKYVAIYPFLLDRVFVPEEAEQREDPGAPCGEPGDDA